jgi:signal transduction histidine kinase
MSEIRPSLVYKLNLRLFSMLLSAFIAINLVIIVIAAGSTMYHIEEGVQDLTESFSRADANDSDVRRLFFELGGYQVAPIPELHGRKLPMFMRELLPVKELDARRTIVVPEQNDIETVSIATRIKQMSYQVTLPINGMPFQITYDLGKSAYRLYVFSIIVLVVEVLALLRSLAKGAFSIRQTLQPISEMAETAKALNAQVASMGAGGVSGDGLQNLAGAISGIDGSQLDQRISVDESHKELKELAQAINLMLNRINASYQSQIRFVSDASHELRTPISVIQGYVNLLDRWGKKDEKTLQESIDAIKSETENMKTLVEHLLFLARGDNDTLQLHLEKFDIAELVEEIVREAKMIDTTHNFQMELQRPIMLVADRQLMKQAIRILLENSIKFTPDNESIILKVLVADNQVKVSVQDNGIGIPPDDVPLIFDRFYRSDESRARKTGGSGLGLSIAKWIIERHHGQFEVISRLDIGTRTTIILPLTDGRAT